MIARPVADFAGAITQLLLPSKVSLGGSASEALSASGVRWTSWVASAKTLRRSCGRQGATPAGVDAGRDLRVPGGLKANADVIGWQIGCTDDASPGDFTVEISR